MKNLSLKPSSLDFLFRFGLSTVFLVNSLTAWFSPDEFLEFLKNNPLASMIAAPQFWVYIIGINDALLFLFILFGRWRRGVALWAVLWMFAVIYVTISGGIIDLIEHIGVLSLVVYFAFRQTAALKQ